MYNSLFLRSSFVKKAYSNVLLNKRCEKIMKTVIITHSCGHEAEHQLLGTQAQIRFRKQSLSEHLCTRCWRHQQEKESQKAADWCREQGFPFLSGSIQQIAWAELIRYKFFNFISSDKLSLRSHPLFPQAVEILKHKRNAHWWIEHKKNSPKYIVELALDEAKHHERIEDIKPEVDRLLINLKRITLTGSAKQIAWAEEIREHFLRELLNLKVSVQHCLEDESHWHDALETVRQHIIEIQPDLDLLLFKFTHITASQFWIEYRSLSLFEIIKHLDVDERHLAYIESLNGKMAFLLNL